MVVSPLAIPEECKDPNYHYHWVNDVRGRIQMLTTQDDYDVVTMDELEEQGQRSRADFSLNRDGFSGNGSTVSLAVNTDGMRAVLLKKRLTFYEADYQEVLDKRQAMMEGRVYHGDLSADGMGSGARKEMSEGAWDGRETYIPKSVNPSLPPMRRKGPVTTKRL